MSSTHYNGCTTGAGLYEFASKAAPALIQYCDEHDVVPILFYQGMSGTATASALVYELIRLGKVPAQVYVRKPGEDSHGNPVEIYAPYREAGKNKPKVIWVWVDDFIHYGETILRCQEEINSDISNIRSMIPAATLIHIPDVLAVCADSSHIMDAEDAPKFLSFY